ncbi:MAG: hypothetical protein CO093_08965 [Alphaproteobacteria bacterium CG_4_9_14_3_um_filter_47_13]|nr:MAG: hypothetical protein CO093_08965 [Alphaproteobacteria bacterium CG_4_9_14_3_um_filter_47_13]
MDIIYWDHYYNNIIILNLLIVVLLFTALRIFSGVTSHISAADELLRKDNPAFGISLAATMFAITIMLTGTIYGSPEADARYAILAVGVFGFIGIALMALTRVILDKVTLPSISLRDEIVKGNIAVGIADAGNILAAAVILRAVLIWVIGFNMESLLALLSGYAVSQCVLTAMTLLKRHTYRIFYKGGDLQEQLKNGNIAVALRFAGRKIGTAFAIATAAHIVVYEQYEVSQILVAWFIASVVAVIVWEILCFAAEQIILWRVDTRSEVQEQKNIAIGAVQAVIYIAMGLLISSI